MTKRQTAALCMSTVNPSPNVSLMTFRRASNHRTHASMRQYRFLTVCLYWSCLILLANGSSASSATGQGGMEGVAGASQFVSVAPLIVAAVCRDGVAVVAAHTSTYDEPLLYHSTLDSDVEKKDSDNDSDNDEHSESVRFKDIKDLPLDYGGPFRIHPIDLFGTALVSAGWRADCEVLASRCRSIAASHLASMGPPPAGSSSLYGHFVATELSMYMSQCAVSERMRTLSCVGLLMTPGIAGKPGCLWLVDATGVYPVRAHCIGGGLSFASKTPELVSNRVNTQLGRLEFSTLDVKEGARRLVGLLAGETVDGDGKGDKKESLLKVGTRLEVAIAESGKRRMRRLQLLTPFEIG